MTKKLRRAAVAERGVRNACISERKREETDICEAKGTEQRSCEVTKLDESVSVVKIQLLSQHVCGFEDTILQQ